MNGSTMNWKLVALIQCLIIVSVAGLNYWVGYHNGKHDAPTMVSAECEKLAIERVAKYAQDQDRDKNQCVCGNTQTCSFGPGVVGTQFCRTDAEYLNRWSRCEPDPSWKKPE